MDLPFVSPPPTIVSSSFVLPSWYQHSSTLLHAPTYSASKQQLSATCNVILELDHRSVSPDHAGNSDRLANSSHMAYHESLHH